MTWICLLLAFEMMDMRRSFFRMKAKTQQYALLSLPPPFFHLADLFRRKPARSPSLPATLTPTSSSSGPSYSASSPSSLSSVRHSASRCALSSPAPPLTFARFPLSRHPRHQPSRDEAHNYYLGARTPVHLHRRFHRARRSVEARETRLFQTPGEGAWGG
jgi:hypothetical protein